jgi:hypothetical protein
MPALLLEDAVTVGKAAGGTIELQRPAEVHVEGLERLQTISQLEPVSADVLDRRRADSARDEREILEPGQPLASVQRTSWCQFSPAPARTYHASASSPTSSRPAIAICSSRPSKSLLSTTLLPLPRTKRASSLPPGELRQLPTRADLGKVRRTPGQGQRRPPGQIDVGGDEVGQGLRGHRRHSAQRSDQSSGASQRRDSSRLKPDRFAQSSSWSLPILLTAK